MRSELVIPTALADAIQRGEAVLWTGSGLGRLAGRQGWSETLRELIERAPADRRSEPLELIEQGRLNTVLSWVHRHLGAATLQRVLDDRSNEGHPPDTNTGALLGRLPWRAVLSTLHADVAWACLRAAGIPAETLSPSEAHEPSLRGNTVPFVMRTPASGRAMRADRPFFELIEEIVRTRTLLFLGFDPDDPDLAQILSLLDRIGRGRRHFAMLPFVSTPEAEEMLERYGIEVVTVPRDVTLARQITELAAAVARSSPAPADSEADYCTLDLARMLSAVDVRADHGADEAVVLDRHSLEQVLSTLPGRDWGAIDEPRTLLKLGVVLLAHGRVQDADRVFRRVITRGVGREFEATARFNLGLTAAVRGDAAQAVEGLVAAAEAVPALAVVPPRFQITSVHGREQATLELLCRDRADGRMVDVTVTSLGRRATPGEQARYVAELSRLREVDHPAIRRPHGVYADGHLFAALSEPLPGFSLSDLLAERRGQPESLDKVFEILGPIMEGLERCHARGILHRAISPRNILLTPNGPVLRGFSAPPAANLLRASYRASYLPWMAPECWDGTPPDAAAETYAIAAVAVQCLTGHPPVRAIPAIAASIAQGEAGMWDALTSALHPEPTRRPALTELRSRLAASLLRAR